MTRKQMDLPKKYVAILRSLSDQASLDLFFGLGKSVDDLSDKQYYTRMRNLINNGIITRVGINEYEHTSAGLVVIKALALINKAVKHNSLLQAYDVLKREKKSTAKIGLKLIDDPDLLEVLYTAEQKRVDVGATTK